MAVYTQLGAETMAAIIAEFDVGTLVSARGHCRGRVEQQLADRDGTRRRRFRVILTMYEHHMDTADLPFFLNLLDHLSARGCPVPRTIHDRANQPFRFHGRRWR